MSTAVCRRSSAMGSACKLTPAHLICSACSTQATHECSPTRAQPADTSRICKLCKSAAVCRRCSSKLSSARMICLRCIMQAIGLCCTMLTTALQAGTLLQASTAANEATSSPSPCAQRAQAWHQECADAQHACQAAARCACCSHSAVRWGLYATRPLSRWRPCRAALLSAGLQQLWACCCPSQGFAASCMQRRALDSSGFQTARQSLHTCKHGCKADCAGSLLGSRMNQQHLCTTARQACRCSVLNPSHISLQNALQDRHALQGGLVGSSQAWLLGDHCVQICHHSKRLCQRCKGVLRLLACRCDSPQPRVRCADAHLTALAACSESRPATPSIEAQPAEWCPCESTLSTARPAAPAS